MFYSACSYAAYSWSVIYCVQSLQFTDLVFILTRALLKFAEVCIGLSFLENLYELIMVAADSR